MANEFKVKKGLIVHGSGSTVLDIQGSQGQLFSITDDLTGTLFAVSDISGVPIFDVNADGTSNFDGNLNLGDNSRLQLGASQDLQIYHDGSNSYISELGTGDLIISADNDLTFKDGSGNIMANMNASNSVELMFGNVKKFETTSTGVTITGELEATTLDINGNADISGDLVITGNIKNNIENGSLDLYGGADATNDAHIKLYGNNSQWASIVMDHGYDAANSKFIVNQGGTERFKIQNNVAYFSGNINMTANATVDGVDISALPTTFADVNAEQNVQSDWNATSGDALILNKPTIPSAITDYVSAANGGTFAGDITITGASTPKLVITDTTNDLTGQVRVANNYMYINIDSPDSVSSTRLHFQTDGDTAMYLDQNQNATFEGDVLVNADLTVTGKVTAQEFHTEFVSASIMYESGSTKFGDTSDDTHKFTGSLYIDEGDIHLDSGRYIKFYGITSNNHSIGSVDANGTNSDDIRINSYHNVFVDLDSNNNNTDTTTFFQISQHSAASTLNTPFFKVRGDGRVGINEDSPDSVLHINTGTGTGNANTVIIDRAGSSDYSGISFATAGTIDWSIGQNSAGNFELFEDGQDAKTRMTIEIGGNVGIGTTDPDEKLHIEGGNLKLENGATSVNRFIPIGTGGNAALSIKGGNFVHNVYFDTSWNDFRYARLTSSYNTSDSSFYLYKSDASGGTSATTTISTGTSTFAGDILMPTAGQQLRIGSFTDGSSNNGEYANDDLVVGDGSISIYPHRRGDYILNESTATSTTFRSKLNIWSDNEDHITFGGADTHMVSAWETWKIWINNDSASNGIFKLYHTNAKTEFARFSGDGTTSFITGKFKATKELAVSSVATTNGSPATDNISVSGYGMIGNRGSVYLTNANTDSAASVQIGVGGVHAAATKLLINPSNSIFSTNVRVGADSTYSLGTSAARWANVYADFYYGDGSNLTNITYTETDTLDSVTGRGATTSNNISVGTIGSGAITSTGKIQGTELEGTSLDINGNADISGNLTLGGAVTVDNPLNYQFNLASNALITPSYTNAVSTPFGDTWHDTLAFQRNYTVLQETSTDNSSWTTATTTAGLFVQKDKTSHGVVGNGVRAIRWTFTGVAYNVARFIHIASGYSSPSPSCAVTIETSSDNTNWTTIHTSTGVSFSASNRYYTVDPYVGNGGHNYCRITIDKGNTDSKVIRLASIKMLTQRLGDQGKGREDELPFLWDDNKKITLEGGATTNSNSTTIASRKFVARDSNGTGLFADDATSGLSIADNGNATFTGTVGSGAITSTGKITGTELEGTSLDINGNADISGNLVIAGTVDGVDIGALPTTFAPTNAEQNVQSDWNATSGDALILNKPTIPTDHNGLYLPIGGGTVTGDLTVNGKITQAGVVDREEWGRTYAASITTIATLVTSDGSALPTGGAYRMTGHISGTGTEQVSVAVFWNENGTWYCNNTFAGGTSSNHIEFLISGGVPKIKTWHANNYNINVTHERLSLDEGTGTDNLRGYFGADSFLKWTESTNALVVPGSITGTSLDINGNADISGNLSGVDTLTATTLSVTNYGLASGDIPNNNADTTGNAATVTTNANLTGHITSVGNATSLGSFTTAQLNAAISNGSVLTAEADTLDSVTDRGASTTNNISVGTIGSGAITSTGKIQGTELEGTSLDINGNADVSGRLSLANYQTGTTSTSISELRGGFLSSSPETSNAVAHPYLMNDLAHFVERGGTVTITGLSGTHSINGAFRPDANIALSVAASAWSGTTMTIELSDITDVTTLSYGSYVGVTFGNTGFAPASLKVEWSTDNGSTYTTALNNTGKHSYYYTRCNNSATGITNIKLTIGQPSSSLRLLNIFATDYAGDGMRNYFLSKIGGSVYGNINPATDSTYSLGTSALRYANIYADNLYGDGSNLTNVTATSFTETDTLDSVTDRGASTTNNITVGTIGSGAITSTGKISGTELEGTSLDINGDADISGTLTVGTISATNYGLASADIPNNAANTSGNAATATTATNSTQLNGFTLARIDHAEAFHTFDNIDAVNTQARRYHIGRLYGCPAHWDGNWQNIEFNVTAESYESGHLRYRLMGDYGGSGSQASMMDLYLKEASGPMVGRFRFVLGTPVDAGWDHSGQDTFYVDLYAEAANYSQWKINIKTYGHGTQNTNPTSGGATTVFYDSPTASNVATFNESHATIHHLGDEIYHEGHLPTLAELGAAADTVVNQTDFVSAASGGTFGGNISVGTNKYNLTVNAPTSLTTSVVNDTINVTFTASTTSNVDNYLIFSSVAGGDYGLISVIPPADFGATMSIIDDSFNAGGTQAYRVYAVKNGVYSSPLTGSQTFTVGTVEPTNLSVINLNTAYYIQYDAPSSKGRFVTAYNIYKHEHATQSSLDRSSATLIYSGRNNSYMYQISGNNNNNYHQFWVETTVV